MAQTSQSGETGGAGDTTTPGVGRPSGLFGGSTTILLVIFAVAVFWWSRRRRVEMEERLRAQRREAEESAQRSALDVAHLMRASTQPDAAAAAANEGLASAARMPPAGEIDPASQRTLDTQAGIVPDAPDLAQAPSGGEEEADAGAKERAAQDAEIEGESLARRMAAASAAAEEADADTAEAEHVGRDASAPTGAVAGDGTVSCPPDFPIKGNRQSRIFHRPGQVSYPSTVAEFCFDTVEAAEAAGFRESRARAKRSQ